MPPWWGAAHGLTIASELPLGGTSQDPGSSADLWLRLDPGARAEDLLNPVPGDQVASLTAPDGAPFYAVGRVGDATTIRFHGMCDLVVDSGREDVVVRVGDSDLAVVAELVAGAGLATILCLAGMLVLHASTFALGPVGAQAAVAVIGPSQAGKSTLTALACAAGASFVGDDVLRVDMEPGGTLARAGHSEVSLRQPVADRVLGYFPAGTTSRALTGGRIAVSLERVDAVPLRAFVFPVRTGDVDGPRIERRDPVDSLLAIARSPGMAGWRAAPQIAAQHRGAERLAERVPVFRLTMPERSRPDLPVVQRALALLASELNVAF